MRAASAYLHLPTLGVICGALGRRHRSRGRRREDVPTGTAAQLQLVKLIVRHKAAKSTQNRPFATCPNRRSMQPPASMTANMATRNATLAAISKTNAFNVRSPPCGAPWPARSSASGGRLCVMPSLATCRLQMVPFRSLGRTAPSAREAAARATNSAITAESPEESLRISLRRSKRRFLASDPG